MLQKLGIWIHVQENPSLMQEPGIGEVSCFAGSGHWESQALCGSWVLREVVHAAGKCPGKDTCTAGVEHCRSCVYCRMWPRRQKEPASITPSTTSVLLAFSTDKTLCLLAMEKNLKGPIAIFTEGAIKFRFRAENTPISVLSII
jgi:hypothetical protein